MAIAYAKKTATLEGQVVVEDAEELAAWIRKTPKGVLNVAGLDNVHAAVLQVLLALKPRIQGEPANPWLRAVLAGPARPH